MRSIWKPICAIIALAIMVFLALWLMGRPPRRPPNLSNNALYIEKGVVPFKLSSVPGNWLDCWVDQSQQLDHCRLSDERGITEFEDVFATCENKSDIPQGELIFDKRLTGDTWVGSYEKHIDVPVIYLQNGKVLLPKSAYQESRKFGCG